MHGFKLRHQLVSRQFNYWRKLQVAAAESLLNNGSSPWSPEVWTAVSGGFLEMLCRVGNDDETQARDVVLV